MHWYKGRRIKVATSIILFILFFIPTALGYGLVSTQGNITMNTYNITLLPTLNLTSMSSDGTTLSISINSTTFTLNSSSDFNLTNVTYLNDTLGFTINASSGILNISAHMLNNNKLYYLYDNGTLNTIYTSNSSGYVWFNYSAWSQSHDFSIQPDTSNPAMTSESRTPASVEQGNTVTITAAFMDDNAVSSAKVAIALPDSSLINYTMTCTAGASVTCTKAFSGTTIIGTYNIMYYYPKDNTNNEANISSALSFQVTALSGGSSGGSSGGGGGTTTIIIKETENATTASPLLTLKNITATQPELEEISRCLTESLFIANKCSGYNYGVIIEPMNWFLVFSGAFLAAGAVVVGKGLSQDKAREWVTEPLLYGTTTTLIIIILVASGVNLYILNFIIGSPKYAWTFGSTFLWGGIVALVWDNYYYGKKTYRILRTQ